MPNTSKVLRKHLFHPVSPTTIVDELLSLMPTPSHPRCFCQDHQWSLLGPRITRLLPPWNAVFTWPHTLTLPTCLLLGWSPFSCWILPIFLPFKYWHALSSVFFSGYIHSPGDFIWFHGFISHLYTGHSQLTPNKLCSLRLLLQIPELYI